MKLLKTHGIVSLVLGIVICALDTLAVETLPFPKDFFETHKNPTILFSTNNSDIVRYDIVSKTDNNRRRSEILKHTTLNSERFDQISTALSTIANSAHFEMLEKKLVLPMKIYRINGNLLKRLPLREESLTFNTVFSFDESQLLLSSEDYFTALSSNPVTDKKTLLNLFSSLGKFNINILQTLNLLDSIHIGYMDLKADNIVMNSSGDPLLIDLDGLFLKESMFEISPTHGYEIPQITDSTQRSLRDPILERSYYQSSFSLDMNNYRLSKTTFKLLEPVLNYLDYWLDTCDFSKDPQHRQLLAQNPEEHFKQVRMAKKRVSLLKDAITNFLSTSTFTEKSYDKSLNRVVHNFIEVVTFSLGKEAAGPVIADFHNIAKGLSLDSKDRTTITFERLKEIGEKHTHTSLRSGSLLCNSVLL